MAERPSGTSDGAPVALVTDADQYAGPASVAALAGGGYVVDCHSSTFANPAARGHYEAGHPSTRALPAQDPDALVADVLSTRGRLDVLVCNQYLPGNRWGDRAEGERDPRPHIEKVLPEDIDLDGFREILETLTVIPLALAKAALPGMKARRSGTIVFVTSAASFRSFPDMPTYAAARSATTSLAQAIAVAVAPFNVQVNVIGPAWFDNPSFFPAEHHDRFQPQVAANVPTGRLATTDEMSALITFLASGAAMPLTGQFLSFTSASSGLGLRG